MFSFSTDAAVVLPANLKDSYFKNRHDIINNMALLTRGAKKIDPTAASYHQPEHV
jgi:hypothetical protein